MEEILITIKIWILENPVEAAFAKLIGDTLPRFGASELYQFIKVSYHSSKLIFVFTLTCFALLVLAIPYRLKKQSFTKGVIDYLLIELFFLKFEKLIKSYHKENIEGKFKLIW